MQQQTTASVNRQAVQVSGDPESTGRPQDPSHCHPDEILPAYASTDIVQGLNRIFSSRTSSSSQRNHWNGWCANGNAGSGIEQTASLHERNGIATAGSSGSRYGGMDGHNHSSRNQQNLPTVTAFQRFSSLFKRNNSRSKNRSSQSHPVSDCHPPPEYTTLPRGNHSLVPTSRFQGLNQQQSRTSVSRHSFTNRMCFSYDSARAAYELAAMSPSSSSNSSSSGGLDSLGPRGRELNQQQGLSLHSQQFQDDLRRHLPPLQTSSGNNAQIFQDHDSVEPVVFPSTPRIAHQNPPYVGGSVGINNDNNDHDQQGSFNSAVQLHSQNERKIVSGNSFDDITSAPIVYDLTGPLPQNGSTYHSPFSRHEYVTGRQEPLHACTDPSNTSSFNASSSLPISRTHHFSHPPAPNGQSQDSNMSNTHAENSRHMQNKTPSPPFITSGVMRRSHSGISEVSMFSVCSETGEKRSSRTGDSPVLQSRVLASDSQYPEHPSLSRHRLGNSCGRADGSITQPKSLSSQPDDAYDLHIKSKSDSVQGGNNTHCQTEICDFVEGAGHCSGHDSVSALNVTAPKHCGKCNVNKANIHKIGCVNDGIFLKSDDVSENLMGTHCHKNDLNQIGGRNSTSEDGSILTISSTPLNIRPSSPFVTSQSGQPILTNLDLSKQPITSTVASELKTKSGHIPEGKKLRKKRSGSKDKDKSHIPHPSPQHDNTSSHLHPKSKHLSSSSSRHGTATFDAYADTNGKEKRPRTSKSRPLREVGEKKKRNCNDPSLVLPSTTESGNNSDQGLSFDHVSHSHNNSYGNADVYRSFPCESVPYAAPLAAAVLSNEYHPSLHACYGDDADGKDSIGMNAALPGQVKIPGHHSQRQQIVCHQPLPPATTKKKSAHKRQSSVGDRHAVGPIHQSHSQHSHQRPRPKSFNSTSADRSHHSRRGATEAQLPLPPDMMGTSPAVTFGKGAKSGCGNDLNLDDQMGIIDFFNEGVDYSANKRPSVGSRGSFSAGAGDSNNSSSAATNSGSRLHSHLNQSGGRSPAIETGGYQAAQHSGNNRSGLSSDLSFTNCHVPFGEKSKKRASLPSLPIFSSSGHGSGRNFCGKVEEKTERGERHNHRSSVQAESHSEATSYV